MGDHPETRGIVWLVQCLYFGLTSFLTFPLGNIPLSILPMMYLGSINLFYYVYASVRGLLAKLRLMPKLQRHIEPKLIMEQMAKRQQLEMLAASKPLKKKDSTPSLIELDEGIAF